MFLSFDLQEDAENERLTEGKAEARLEIGRSQALFAALTKSSGLRSHVIAFSSVIIPASVARSQKYEDT